jgi:hypothetical protein
MGSFFLSFFLSSTSSSSSSSSYMNLFTTRIHGLPVIVTDWTSLPATVLYVTLPTAYKGIQTNESESTNTEDGIQACSVLYAYERTDRDSLSIQGRLDYLVNPNLVAS